MANSIGKLEVDVSTNLASLYTGLNQAADRISQFGNKVSGQLDRIGASFDRVNTLFAALGVSLGVGAFAAGVKSAIDYADRLNDLSKQTGIAVETLGGLGYAAKQSGVDLESVAKGVQKLARTMAEAAGGNDQLSTLFERMGVQTKDLATGGLRPLDKVLGDVATKFASYADGPEKAALATELFGKAGANLIPLLNEGGEKLRELVAEYERYGGVTADTAARADAFNDTLEKIKLIQGSLFREIASALLPTLQAIANVFVDAKTKGDGFKTVAEGIVVVVKALAIAGVGVVAAFQVVGRSLAAVAAAFAQAIQGNFRGALEALKIGFGDAGDAVKDAIGRAATIWQASTETIAGSTTKNLNQTTAPIKSTAKAADDLRLSVEKLLKPFKDLIAQLGKTGAELDAQLASLREYGVETKATAVATAEYELNQGKLADRLQAISFLYPQLADALRFLILAQAKHNDEVTNAIDLEKKYLDAVRSHNESLADGIRSIEDSIEKEHDRANAIGRTRAEFLDLKIAQEESALASLRVIEGADAEIRAAELRIKKYKELRDATAGTDALEAQQRGIEEQQRAWTDLFNNITDRGAQFITDFVENGSSAFKNLWEDFKHWAIAALAKIAAQKIIVSIAGSIGLTGAGAAAANPLSGLGGGSDLLGGVGNFLFGEGSAGASALGAGFNAGIETLSTAAKAGVDSIGGVSSALGALGAVAGPLIPILGLAVPLLGGLFKKEPSQVKGQFGITSGSGGFEDNSFTSSKFGNLGFLDSNTQQFSGEAAQVFNKIVAGALDAFSSRYSQEQSERLADILQGTTFASAEGTFTTQDFLQKYGGEVLQQVVVAAFEVLDPALAKVARGFTGTADEIAQFSNVLLAVHDAAQGLDATVRANVLGALDSTVDTANKVLAFVNVLQLFGDSLTGLRPALESLDPAKITEFVDALGGAQAFFDSFSFLSQNFLTSAERTAQAAEQLTASFDALGVAVPETHQAFLDLVKAAVAVGDVDLAASLQKLAPLFVEVKGTADQAAEATKNLANAAGDAADAIQQAAADIGVSVGKIIDAGTSAANKLLDAFADLASASTGDFGAKLSLQIGLIRDAIKDAGAVQGPTGDFRLLGGSQADKIYVSELNKSYQRFASELARFTILSAQYDAARAEQLVALEEWYADQQKIFVNNDSALDALSTIFQQKWNAIVNGSAEAVQALDDFIAKIRGIADATGGNAGQQAGIELALSSARIADLQEQYAKALPGSALAASIQADISKLQQYNASLATQIAHFAIYTAQYGKSAANQLVELENWYAEQQDILDGNTGALAILGDIFQDKWNEIIAGLGDGVDGSLEQLARLKEGIADYLKGLVVSDISPLSAIEKLRQAETAFQAEYAKAQAGDTGALADVTKFADTYLNLAREFYKSSQPFVDIFNQVTGELGTLAGTTPTGQPLTTGDAVTAIATALPAGTLASSDDMKAVRDLLQRLITDLANANTADSIAERQALQNAADDITAAIAGASELK